MGVFRLVSRVSVRGHMSKFNHPFSGRAIKLDNPRQLISAADMMNIISAGPAFSSPDMSVLHFPARDL